MQQGRDQTGHQTITVGQVVDTNDPQQMGRIRALCPAWGDTPEKLIRDIPWAAYVSPFAGTMTRMRRGPELEQTPAAVSYGMWNIPKVGSYVLIGCIDGHPGFRYWFGCLQPQLMTHTMPHGRFLWTEQQNGEPDGPVDSGENPIEPLYSNLTEQFTNNNSMVSGTPTDPRRNIEWRSRGVDTQVAAIAASYVDLEDNVFSEVADHTFGQFITITQENGEPFTLEGPGYSISQFEPDTAYSGTVYNYDSNTYSWTTPGFHSISMDDRYWNSRMRFRTTAGNQILLDDTNERIYVSTAQGKTWVELDRVGNVDIYAERNVSVRAGGDINYSTDQTFRVKAKQGIHMHTDGEFRATSGEAFHVSSGSTLKLTSSADVKVKSGGNQDVQIQSAGNLQGDSIGNTTFNADGDFLVTGSSVHMNGPPAPTLNLSTANEAYWTSRVPEHEPWARVFVSPDSADQDSGNNWQPEYDYTDIQVGRGSDARGESYDRNPNWRR